MDYSNIREQAEHYVRTFFETHDTKRFIYHNLYHTVHVVEACSKIAHHYHLQERELFIVTVAAWFHDIGYLQGGSNDHEEKGASTAAAFLSANGVDTEDIDAVKKCILATKLPQSPTNLLESIVCDSDLFHLGTDEFRERNKLMRKEVEVSLDKKIDKENWRRGTIHLLEIHHYHTDYARSLLDEKKQENLAKLKEKDAHSKEKEAQLQEKEMQLQDKEASSFVPKGPRESLKDPSSPSGLAIAPSINSLAGPSVDPPLDPTFDLSAFDPGSNPISLTRSQTPIEPKYKEEKFKEKKSKEEKNREERWKEEKSKEEKSKDDKSKEDKDKKKEPKDAGRGIDTVFRIASNNNQRLSIQADNKAHIMITVNSIIISVLLSLLLRKIEDHQNLAIPSIILLTVNLVTIIFSILATRPHIPEGTFTKADLDEKKVNLLFFGNFYNMSLEDYAEGMWQMMGDRDFLYGSLVRDVYYQGIALGRKFKWLRVSYNVFMFGLIISVIAFVFGALAYPGK
ncbi:Pycsar system effector family protein [Flavitalea flava]